ncbi:hypothetical protein AOLI_G00065520 [Acnodon oligacanthus]
MISKKINLLWILIASLYRIGPVQAVDLQQKPSFLSANLGEAVTLHCTFDESTSNERMVWYKQKVGQTLQQTSSSRQCEISSSTNCSLYEFSKNILDHHHTGTYYCAVAACGKIIVGNGTTVELTEKLKDSVKEKTIKQDEDAEELNYAALNFHERKTKRARVKREQPKEDTLYSAVRGSCVNDRRVTH